VGSKNEVRKGVVDLKNQQPLPKAGISKTVRELQLVQRHSRSCNSFLGKELERFWWLQGLTAHPLLYRENNKVTLVFPA
jgi:hypothetical protein